MKCKNNFAAQPSHFHCIFHHFLAFLPLNLFIRRRGLYIFRFMYVFVCLCVCVGMYLGRIRAWHSASSCWASLFFLYPPFYCFFHNPHPILPFGAPGKARKTLDISFAIFFSCLHFMTFSLALLGGGWVDCHTYTDKRKFLLFFLPALSPARRPAIHQKIGNICVMQFSLLAGKRKFPPALFRFFCSFLLLLYHSSLFQIVVLIPCAMALHFPIPPTAYPHRQPKMSCRIYVVASICAR